jgi:hypothetical protein
MSNGQAHFVLLPSKNFDSLLSSDFNGNDPFIPNPNDRPHPVKERTRERPAHVTTVETAIMLFVMVNVKVAAGIFRRC